MMKTQQPIIREDEEHRVLKFVPRTSVRTLQRSTGQGYGVQNRRSVDELDNVLRENMARFEQAPDEPDDFRHRMLANTAAFALTVILTAIGIWLTISIADLRKTQDCVLMGRRDCGRISTPQI